jgi:hypothetical protein
MKHMGPHWFDEKIKEHPADPEFANFEKHWNFLCPTETSTLRKSKQSKKILRTFFSRPQHWASKL